ncbi:GGDEF domain-containing protein [Bradyrhizobium sp. NAS96.2]|uniref:GGDEF domain-containing protein n=1 Tax=Bradyrhizobium sp. NAS96.2 TaxID=1680160 RepID=UPI00094033FF|nr:GGDEF domain-containing protein [Bradyrhizobium sp. NAS96.2]OKO71074.1 hypothetical protein AC628_29235 [Bradyrhizobium sp. NAS96.2]
MNQLKVLAETDGLTSLLNRRALDRIVERLGEENTPEDDHIALILMDIDHFKSINDNYGHPAGDRVLAQAAELLRGSVRTTDIVARFGGEEFAVLLPAGDLSVAISVARKVRIALQEHSFVTPAGEALKVTASFGVARGRRGPEEWHRLLAQADAALYQAKADGRNRVRFGLHSLGHITSATELEAIPTAAA